MRGFLGKVKSCFEPKLAQKGLNLYKIELELLNHWSCEDQHVFLKDIVKFSKNDHLRMKIIMWGVNEYKDI